MSAPPREERPESAWLLRLERLINPLLRKDLLVYARGTRQVGGVSALLAYALIFALPLLGFAYATAFVPGAHRFFGRHVYLGLCAILAFVHLSVAVPASTAFALERDRNTLEGLIVSPLGAWRLVVGKLASAVAVGVLAKAALLPLLGVAFALGGGELGFLPRYLLVLVAIDLSLASLAIYLGHRTREAPSRLGWIKNQATQSQLALQTTVGISVLGFLLPFYAVGFLIPLSLKHGTVVAEVLEVVAPLGALHPLATLATWGPADLFGLSVPVWVLAVLLHVLVALPLVAATAEGQRTEGAAPGRLPRLLAIPALLILVVILGAVLARSPLLVRTITTLCAAGVLVWVCALSTGFREEGGRPTSLGPLLRGFLPWEACRSAPASAPGYTLWIGLGVALPLLLWAGQGSRAAWGSGLALTLAGVSLAALGARLQARVREREEEAFLAALRGQAADAPEPDEDPEESERRRKSWPTRVLSGLVLAGFFLPPVGGALIGAIDAGSLPGLAGLRPALGLAVGFGLSLNPCAGGLPFAVDPGTLGTDLGLRALERVGVAPWAVFGGHLLIYGALLLGALVTLRAPLDLNRALAEEGQGDGPPAEVERPQPSEPSGAPQGEGEAAASEEEPGSPSEAL